MAATARGVKARLTVSRSRVWCRGSRKSIGETTEEEVAERVDAICRGLGVTLPPASILYRPMYRALADEAPRLRADLARHGVGFVIVNSFAPAAGVELESANSTIRTMNALRSFTGTTRLVLAHVRLSWPSAPGPPSVEGCGALTVRSTNLERANLEWAPSVSLGH